MFSKDLIEHAFRLSTDKPNSNVDRRRAISSAYYALFHHLSEAAVRQIAPQVTQSTANRIHRWLDHTEMKRICAEFSTTQLTSPLREMLGSVASKDMQELAISFIRLQEARHKADYDLNFEPEWQETRQYLIMAGHAMRAWDRVSLTPEGNIFLLSLLLWKKWTSSRQ
jgi:uncharacterized protein (UPF0332 family)